MGKHQMVRCNIQHIIIVSKRPVGSCMSCKTRLRHLEYRKRKNNDIHILFAATVGRFVPLLRRSCAILRQSKHCIYVSSPKRIVEYIWELTVTLSCVKTFSECCGHVVRLSCATHRSKRREMLSLVDHFGKTISERLYQE